MNPDFSCFNSFVLSWVDKYNAGTKGFVSAIAKVVTLLLSEATQFSEQVRIRLISELIKGISRVLRNYLTHLTHSYFCIYNTWIIDIT